MGHAVCAIHVLLYGITTESGQAAPAAKSHFPDYELGIPA